MPKVRQLFYGNFDTALKATETAYNSTGSAARENQKVLESLNGSIQKLKAEWESLASSKATQDTLKFFIDLTTNIIKLLKQIGGLRTAFIALATVMAIKNAASILSFYKTFSGIISTIATVGLPKYVAWLKMASAAEQKEAATAKAASLATMKLQLALGAIGIVIAVVTSLMGNLNEEYERNAEALSNAQQKYDETHSELESVNNKLAEIDSQIEEINKNPLDPTREQTLKDLKAQREELEKQYAILTQIDDLNRVTLLNTAYKGLMGQSKNFTVNDAKLASAYGTPEEGGAPRYLYTGGIFKTADYGPLMNQIGQVRQAYQALEAEQYAVQVQMQNASKEELPTLQEKYDQLEKKIQSNLGVWASMMNTLKEYKVLIKDNLKVGDENYEMYMKLLILLILQR